jgi:3-demethoxyubiquinol 3-hydroxylase
MLNVDRLIVEFDKGLRTLFSQAHSARPYPDAKLPDAAMSDAEKSHAAALMRVNHSGEICAQVSGTGADSARSARAAKAPAGRAGRNRASRLDREAGA